MNNSLWSFSPVFSMAFDVALALSLLAFFVYKEIKRKQKFLILRMVALILVVISLLGLLLRPIYEVEKKTDSIVLLTKGYQRSKVDSIIQTSPKLKVVSTPDAASYPNASILKSWYELRDENIFCVVGQGIPRHALDLIHNKTFRFIPATIPPLILKLTIPTEIYTHERRQITGSFSAAERTKLKLLGPAGVIDSARLDVGENTFSLSFTPKLSGNFIYSLVAEGLSGSVTTERLPVEVLGEKRLRILFIQKFPTAEVRYLKNFLSERHHQIAIRYQISKNNFTYEFANLPRERIDNLRSGLLNSFDVLFIDQRSYNEMSALERNDLKKSIHDGLGVIFLLRDAKEKALSEFLSIKSRISPKDTTHIRLSPSHLNVLPVLPLELENDPSIVPITKNKNRILSGYLFSGHGKVGFQFIHETFRIGLEGNSDGYASLWTNLIGKTARSKELNFKLKLITPFPYYPNEPLDVIAASSGLQPTLYEDAATISLKENALVDDYWTGRSWAGKSGWHRFQVKQDSTHLYYFVSDTSEWKTLRIADQIKGSSISQNMPMHGDENVLQRVPVPPLAFYFIFLFSSAFLWLAPKI